MTVRTRLTLIVTILFAMVVVLASAGLVQAVERGVRSDVETRLQMAAEQLRTRLTSTPQGPLPVGSTGERFLVVGAGGDVIAASPGIPADAARWVASTPAVAVRDDRFDQWVEAGEGPSSTRDPFDPAEEPLALFSLPSAEIGSQIIATTSLAPAQQSIDQLQRILAVAVPAAVLFVGWAAWLLIGRALRPVEAITAQVDRITASTLAARVPEPAGDDEIGHLARTMNRMLERLELAGEAQQRFSADASHELRSPLTAVRAELEATLLDRDAPDWPATARRVLAETAHLERLVGDLLLLARLDAGASGRVREVDLDDVVVLRAGGGGAHVTMALQPVKVTANPDQLGAVVRNLIDNAVRHATSRVRISTVADDAHAVLVVEDDGAGIPAADRDRVLEPFVRLQEARTRGDGGTGLGLALVDRIVKAHGGR